jgi:hypothetical protein
MGTLREFFSSCDVPLNIKFRLHFTALWDCESWALLQSDLHKLEVFRHLSIRPILGISLKRVREERKSNKEVRNRSMRMTTIADFTTRRTTKYIVKKIRNENENSLQKQFLTAFSHSKNTSEGNNSLTETISQNKSKQSSRRYRKTLH